MPSPLLPKTIMGYVLRTSGRHQIGLAVLAAGVFGLTSVPLEIQRRIVNDAIKNGATATIVWLALAYAGVALLEQAFKLGLNVYRGWVSEDAVRTLEATPACRLRHLPGTGQLLGKLRLAVRRPGGSPDGWTFPRQVVEALERVEAVPLPARCGFWPVQGGVAVHVYDTPGTGCRDYLPAAPLPSVFSQTTSPGV